MDLFDKLITNVKRYHPSDNLVVIQKAYELAVSAHQNQFRKSGEPYIIHPLSVAIILSELELDKESIVGGLLHDVIEDTNYTYEDITELFGKEVADIVDGVTKLDRIQYTSREEVQAENYRKMFMAMAKDIRVVLIKIADRLHNMQTLEHMTEAKQKEKAQETLDIYVPIAHRLGISTIRYEMEDLCFYYLERDAYNDLSQKVKLHQKERFDYVKRIIDEINTALSKYNISAYVEGRPKHFFSIYKKMLSKNKTFDQIYDLFAVRAIVDSVHDCYAVLGIMHEMYKPIPGRFKDYIAMPKANMYQSLHSTLIGPEGEPFEIQIRTRQMHKVAEYGIAAHWKYKEGKSDSDNDAKLSWLNQILEWQKELDDNKEYLNTLKLDLDVFKSHVYCFTPKGEVISLTSGSTPIDFAYSIHSAVGNKLVGARVNGKIVTLEYVLKTGDRVEIITSQNSKGPNINWLKLVKTSTARNKINQWFRKENKIENVQRGKDLLERECKKKGIQLNELANEKSIDAAVCKYNLCDWEAVCAAIGHGALREGNVVNYLYSQYEHEDELCDTVIEKSDTHKKNSSIIVKGIGDVNVRFSRCCNPLPGDEIVGFVTRGRGVSLHRTDCKNIINLDEFNRQRLIEASWHSDNTHHYAELRITCDDRNGILAVITKLLAKENITIKSLNARTNKTNAIFDIGLEIQNKLTLESIQNKLLQIKGVYSIERK